jgi:hypothetical protein
MAARHRETHGVWPAECHLGSGWGEGLAQELAQAQLVDGATLAPYASTPAEILDQLHSGKVKLLGMTVTVNK